MPLWRALESLRGTLLGDSGQASGRENVLYLAATHKPFPAWQGPVVAAPGALVPQRQSRLKMPFSDLICPVGGLHAGGIWAAGLSGQ